MACGTRGSSSRPKISLFAAARPILKYRTARWMANSTSVVELYCSLGTRNQMTWCRLSFWFCHGPWTRREQTNVRKVLENGHYGSNNGWRKGPLTWLVSVGPQWEVYLVLAPRVRAGRAVIMTRIFSIMMQHGECPTAGSLGLPLLSLRHLPYHLWNASMRAMVYLPLPWMPFPSSSFWPFNLSTSFRRRVPIRFITWPTHSSFSTMWSGP